ncbi:hypothetical protein H4R26_005316 [Coemansia thaxteri]|uniref:Aminotransferase class I/classII large domain-containing protein n=1 Tax=Coemansia thaxteri TaxID=2663907 RepID=A0A9W8B8Y4_9FUNG|nr:hypothetical protein H4R26_005316 [Coemansia thaxteri]
MGSPALELSAGALASLNKEPIIFKAFTWMGKNPYSKDSNPQGIINAGIAANKTVTPLLLDKLNSLAKVIDSDLEYNSPYGGPELRGEIANLANRHFNPAAPVLPDDIVVTNGCTTAIEMLAFATCEPGDRILIPTPCYAALDSDMSARAQARATMVELPVDEVMSVSQIEYFERALSEIKARDERAKMLFLMSPHNPLGISYPKNVLRAFLEFASRHSLFVVVDEIYALSVFDRADDVTPFESVLSWPDLDAYIDPSAVIVLHGLSKDFGLNGFRMGWIMSPWNKQLLGALKSYSPFGYRPAYTDRMIASLLSDHEFVDGLFKTSQKQLAAHYKRTADFFTSHGIEFVPCTAGHYVWLRLPVRVCAKTLQALGRITAAEAPKVQWNMANELIVWESLICNERIYMPPGQAFSAIEAGWFRFTFSISKSELDLALDRLSRGCFL